MVIQPTMKDAYRLMHEGTLALACVEEWGMRIDVPLLEKTLLELDHQIDQITADLRNSEVWRLWKRRYGDNANLDSDVQLGVILTDDLGIDIAERTATNRVKVDEKTLAGVDHPFVKQRLRSKKLKKLRDTYLKGLQRELVDGYIHPCINLHLVNSYRSSADRPNVQNQIRRDADFAAQLRRLFIPSPGHVLVEADMSAHEFKIGACRWRDAKLCEYASDPSKDIHRDMASECYLLPKDAVPKPCRDQAKNKFVFPIFYGSYYCKVARDLWTAIELEQLKTADGVPLKQHLANKGIHELGACDPNQDPVPGTFEYHIYQVERDFNTNFPEWSTRKEQALRDYQKRGYFDMMTGFRCSGVYTRNQLYNYGVQGPAFHTVLWSLIQMVKWIRRNKMRSRIICEIHDSIIADVHRDELDDYLVQIQKVMTQDVREHMKWIIVPLAVEVDLCENNWFEKKRVV